MIQLSSAFLSWQSCKQKRALSKAHAAELGTSSPEGEKLQSDSGVFLDSYSLQDNQLNKGDGALKTANYSHFDALLSLSSSYLVSPIRIKLCSSEMKLLKAISTTGKIFVVPFSAENILTLLIREFQ